MKKRGIFWLVFLSVCCGLLFGQSGATGVRFKEGVIRSEIKVSVFDNVIYIPVSVNSHPPVDFVLDTGAPQLSIIEMNLLSKFKLEARKGGELGGAGPNRVKFVRLNNVRLSLAGIEISGANMASITLTHMEPYWGKPKFGLLGGNVLKHLVTEIDYIKKRVTFFRPDRYAYRGKGKKIPVQLNSNAILVKAGIRISSGEDDIEGLFLIDTGVRNTFFNTPFVRKHRILDKARKTVDNITGFGIGGEVFGTLSRIKTVEMGGFKLDNTVIELSTDTRGIGASEEFDGIIGADLLSRFRVVFDYTRSEMILEPNENFNHSFNYDMSGLYLIVDKQNSDLYEVAHVVKSSPAESAGVLKGDVLLLVNDQPLVLYNYEQIKQIFKQEGKTVTLHILRNGSTRKFSFRLKKLL